MNHLPKLAPPEEALKGGERSIHFSPLLAEMARLELPEVLSRIKSTLEGLSAAEAAKRLEDGGPNVISAGKRRGWPWRLLTAARNPLVILLAVLAAISFATGDAAAGSVMTLMVALACCCALCRRRGPTRPPRG